MNSKIKHFFVGKPLHNEAIEGQKYGVLWGLPVLSSDAISSVAYAGQEMLLVLLPVIGVMAFSQLTILSACIIGLLAILMLSYRQTIDCYPNGGGAFIVAKDNLGIIAGVVAGAALSVDYILTVALSISSGVQQLTSAFTFLQQYPYPVIITVAFILLIMLGNLRGIRESSRLFGIPAYAFILGIVLMIIFGLIFHFTGRVPTVMPTIKNVGEPLTIILMLRAFSNGCTALTGVEAVSNGVPNFKKPSQKHAKNVLLLLSIVILFLFGGSSILANYFPAHITPGGAMLVQIAAGVFGNGSFMFYYITITTLIILVMAANTAYSDFPILISVMAREGYVPRQLNTRGDRLSFDNGIILLSVFAIILVVSFSAQVSKLIGLYAIGVFISFTLSQTGMFLRWIRTKGKHWLLKAAINGLGAVVTFVVVVIIGITKFNEGAWIVIIIIPILVFAMLKIKQHYTAVRQQLKLSFDEYEPPEKKSGVYMNHVIVLLESVNKSSLRAMKYARTISDDIVAFNVSIDHESANDLKDRYEMLGSEIPLIIKYSPYRMIIEPLLEFIESKEYNRKQGDMITVILPQFVVKKWWHKILHNNMSYYIEKELLKHRHIVVSVMPMPLKDDDITEKH
jgi:amino acid transporter